MSFPHPLYCYIAFLFYNNRASGTTQTEKSSIFPKNLSPLALFLAPSD